jgi:uncharacterized protein (TIGR03503 family)
MSVFHKVTSRSAYYFKMKSVITGLVTCVLFLSILSAGVASPVFAETPKDAKSTKADIRLLIDISGSMKKNDPANLRIPAVSLLTELIPDGDKAGVWTFGQWVNNLVKHQVVNDKWREYAKKEAQKINSVALYTNIGGVLEKASDDFFKQDADFSNTHFILLTDGMVDIDRDPEKNSLERERILSSVLKTIKDRGAKIHAISLSKNADQSLMEKLAIQTGGQSAVAETPEDLTRFFVQALDQAVPSEQVPIEGNEFAIDSSVEEFTALIFRKPDSLPTEIISPDETVYRFGQNNEDIKWFQDQGYDLITIQRPLEGAWTIKADIKPESRVTVISNLQLQMSRLPVNFFAGEQLDVEVSFLEDGKQVVSPEFLSLLDVNLQLKTEEGKTASKSMSTSGAPPEDGVFRDSITKLTKIGQYEVSVLVDGKTFQRSKRQVVNLRAPFDFEFSVKTDKAIPYYELVVTPLNDSISMADTSIFVKTKYPDNTSLISALELDKERGLWILQILPEKGDGLYEVAVKVKSQTTSGKEFQFKPKPFEAEFPIPVGALTQIVSVNDADPETVGEETSSLDEAVESPAKSSSPRVVPELVPESKTDTPVEAAKDVSASADTSEQAVTQSQEENAPEDSSDNTFWWLVSTAITGGLLLISGIVYLILRRRKAAEEPGEILSDEDIEDIESEKFNDVPVIEDTFDEPLIEEPLIDDEPLVETMPEPEPDAGDDLDFTESPAENTQALSSEMDAAQALKDQDEQLVEPEYEETAVDLSAEELGNVLDELEEDTAQTAEEVDMDDIAQAIEDAGDEPPESLPEEIEKALDINEEDLDEDDEEFNLEDFDIGDTDDLPDTDKKP